MEEGARGPENGSGSGGGLEPGGGGGRQLCKGGVALRELVRNGQQLGVRFTVMTGSPRTTRPRDS